MKVRRAALAAVLVVVALVLQVSVVDRLHLPGGALPDLVLLLVVALGLVHGPLPGLTMGFLAGLAADVVPPTDHAIGRYAFVLCLVGYAAGLAHEELDRSALLPFVAMALGALGGSVLYAAVGALFGDPRITWRSTLHTVPLALLYDLIVSPFVLFAVVRLTRRLRAVEQEPSADLTGFSVPRGAAGRYRPH